MSAASPMVTAARRASGRSPTLPSATASPPAARTTAAIIGPLELRVWPWAGIESGGTSSLPVARIATRGGAATTTCVAPASTASPIAAGVNTVPSGSTTAPRRNAVPRRATC
ncbi:MAG: hypothetical protein FJ309_01960 [Planctomycetes bacterium]|nr:hypothetical protein [Planctomycetota bacterium]